MLLTDLSNLIYLEKERYHNSHIDGTWFEM